MAARMNVVGAAASVFEPLADQCAILIVQIPADVAPYLKVRMKLPTPDSIYCARRKYDRQVDRKAPALCMKFTV